eukprot:scaffold9879_cov76-Cyclotella_meneghiniana.AAC.1
MSCAPHDIGSERKTYGFSCPSCHDNRPVSTKKETTMSSHGDMSRQFLTENRITKKETDFYSARCLHKPPYLCDGSNGNWEDLCCKEHHND